MFLFSCYYVIFIGRFFCSLRTATHDICRTHALISCLRTAVHDICSAGSKRSIEAFAVVLLASMSAASAAMGAKGEKSEKELQEPPMKRVKLPMHWELQEPPMHWMHERAAGAAHALDAFVAANLEEKCEGLAQLYEKMVKLPKGDGEKSAESSASSASGPKPEKEEKSAESSADFLKPDSDSD